MEDRLGERVIEVLVQDGFASVGRKDLGKHPEERVRELVEKASGMPYCSATCSFSESCESSNYKNKCPTYLRLNGGGE